MTATIRVQNGVVVEWWANLPSLTNRDELSFMLPANLDDGVYVVDVKVIKAKHLSVDWRDNEG